jgi:hypothetical protein
LAPAHHKRSAAGAQQAARSLNLQFVGDESEHRAVAKVVGVVDVVAGAQVADACDRQIVRLRVPSHRHRIDDKIVLVREDQQVGRGVEQAVFLKVLPNYFSGSSGNSVTATSPVMSEALPCRRMICDTFLPYG